MQLFERIVVLFPVLELFKCTLKSVRGASGRRAAGFARAVMPFVSLRALCISTFANVLPDSHMSNRSWSGEEAVFYSRFEESLESIREGDVARPLEPLTGVSESLLPRASRRYRNNVRLWRVYRVERGNGGPRLCLQPGPEIEMASDDY
ncbi:hypothetical protein BD626DRAFT_44433 [Schizophyllum amplum]|uniref:Uncharacterized protein n=1 Tax=Schizophyllum amplum TaxID=97359 RepID=A0A550CE78_9AGAR|nr:hypothetical protein BD626DRAFT_44433 [Auriculariopsis ampla]